MLLLISGPGETPPRAPAQAAAQQSFDHLSLSLLFAPVGLRLLLLHPNSPGKSEAEGEARAAIMSAESKYVMGKKGERRIRDVELCLPICVGTVSFWQGKKADEYNAHKWTVYVRSPVNEDLSPAVKKVVFHLHHSFQEPVREVTEQPFELTETGWGEFEINVHVHFADEAMEESFQIAHGLQLFHKNNESLSTKKPVSCGRMPILGQGLSTRCQCEETVRTASAQPTKITRSN